MTERPILFSGRLVRAILDGKKSETRRPLRTQPSESPSLQPQRATYLHRDCVVYEWVARYPGLDHYDLHAVCPYGKEGGRLWVRETWKTHERPEDLRDGVVYRADGVFRSIKNTAAAADAWGAAYDNGRHGDAWRPSIFMPRWASRITLEVDRVWAERLQAIDTMGIMAEGSCPPATVTLDNDGHLVEHPLLREAFARSWDQIYAKRGHGWASNPWVWAIRFRTVKVDTGR